MDTEYFKAGRDRGCERLRSVQQPDGSIAGGTLAEYYKVPLAFLVSGASAEANRLCTWIRHNGITSEGDFGPRPPEARGYYYSYYNSWVIMAAQRQGHFDLSRKGMDFVLQMRDAESGGFYCSATEREPDTDQDLWVVAGAGMAALYTGDLDVARGVGGWLRRLMNLQPNFPQQLYCVYNRASGLRQAFAPSEEVRYVLNAGATRDEYFFQPGIAAGFLANLYKATGEPEWRALAQRYMVMPEIAGDSFFRSLRAGKVGWAAAVLYTLTGETKYRDMAIRVGNYLLETQSPEGGWGFSQMSWIDATAEMVVWLDEIWQATGGEARRAAS